MLSVRVHPAAERVAASSRFAVAGGDRSTEAAVLAEGDDVGAVLACDVGGGVGGAVVDDEEVDGRELLAQLGQDGAEVVLLVPGGGRR